MAGFRINNPRPPFYVYVIKNAKSGKCYVGQSHRPNDRYMAHIYAMRGRGHSVPEITADYRKYGLEAFGFAILCKCDTRDEARTKELYYMKVLRSQDPEHGYNYLDQAGTSDISLFDRWRTGIREQADRHRINKWAQSGIYECPKDEALKPTDYWWGRCMSALAKRQKGTKMERITTVYGHD